MYENFFISKECSCNILIIFYGNNQFISAVNDSHTIQFLFVVYRCVYLIFYDSEINKQRK